MVLLHLLVCLLLPFVIEGGGRQEGRGERPELVSSRVTPLHATVAGEYYEYLLTSLEFDQDVYINDAFLCPAQEEGCTPMDCEPCDWSGESPTGCGNERCCGPSQWPQFPASNHTSDWCDDSLPSYTKLEFNQPSETFSVGKGEYQFFRFFVGEEHYCRPIRVEVSTQIGDMSVTISNLVAYPDQDHLKRIENGQQFEAGSVERIARNLFGQSIMNVCPNVNPTYEKGTYSVALVGFYQLNVATITVHLGEEAHPIPPPEDRIKCDDLEADEIFQEPLYVTNAFNWGGNVCLEEGVTSSVAIGREWWDFVLPVLPGCQEISFAFNGFTNTDTDPDALDDARLFVTCGRVTLNGDDIGESVLVSYGNIGQWFMSACFEEITYLHCSVGNFYQPGRAKFVWSTNSKSIRHKITDVSPSMLTTYYGRNQAAMVEKDLTFTTLNDWDNFGWSWVTQPTTDPLVFYPPYGDYSYNFTQDPLEAYLEAGLAQPKSNMFNFFDFTTLKDQVIRSQEVLLEKGFIFLTGLTSETGLPVELCNDSDFENGKCGRGRILEDDADDWMVFLPTRTVASMDVITAPNCDGSAYNSQQGLIQKQVGDGLKSSVFDVLAQKSFLIDLYNAGLTRSSCVMTMERVLETEVDNVTKLQRSYCPYDLNDPLWELDPCCSVRARVAYCCAPTSLSFEDSLYTEANTADSDLTCKNPECAETFFSDIAVSLNTIGNPLTGCASGLQDPEYQLRVLIEESMAELVRPCLVKSGYGDTFRGVECRLNEDCVSIDSTCDMSKGVCRVSETQEIREKYFDCFFDNMPPLVEDHIRTTVLSSADANLPKESDAFKDAVRDAATQFDCIGLDPFDLVYGERYVSDAALYCKGLGLSDLDEIEKNQDSMNEICSEYVCLGQRSCRYEMARMCRTPTDGSECFDSYHKLIAPSESECPTDETICSFSHVSSTSGDCEGDEFQCVSCLSVDSCTVVEGVDTEEECERLVACELVGGGIRYDLTKEECLDLGECSSLCDGQSCRSVDGKRGACVAEGASDCQAIGGEEVEGECILEDVATSYACDQASIELSLVTQWYMCESMSLTECHDHVDFAAPYKYLKCFVDIFRDCENEDECSQTGTCSDIEVAKNVITNASNGWFTVSYGTCLGSGFMGRNGVTEEPYCLSTIDELPYIYGCYHREATKAYCESLIANSFISPYWSAWIEPARTEETCRQNAQGRYGCATPREYELTYWFWQEEDCECKQGTGNYLYTWSPGTWESGTPYSLSWTQKEKRQKYTWEESLSLVTMEQWVRDAIENSFTYAMKSQLVCEGNYVSSTLSALVCDCVSEDESCFDSADIETEVGVMGVCAQETSILKGPSSFTTFYETSVNELCTTATLTLIQKTWFLYPRSPPSVSFQFAEREEKGVVQNSNGADVGVLMGDGSHIVFEKPERVNHFYPCLLISLDEGEYSNEYPRRDFGVPDGDFSTIRPLGLKEIEERKEGLILYWCTNLTEEDQWAEDGVMLFPLLVEEDYEDEDDNFLSRRTESLIYTLAACYIFALIFVLLYVGVTLKKITLKGKGTPMITWLGVILAIVCVFRIVFCFIYVNDGFSPLSEYVVFEIPTFLLFTGVLLVLLMFAQLSKKSSFNFKSLGKRLTILGAATLIFVWSLLIIVTIVYSEVILEESQNGDSACPGRVQSNNDDQEDDTRTLSIVYQTIVICLTLLFAVVFFKQSLQLFRMTKNVGRKASVFVFRLGAITVTSFLLRCILFIVLLAADITSDIYLFITLLLTEVLMIVLIALELNKGFYNSMIVVVTGTINSSSKTGSGGVTSNDSL